MIGTWEKGFAGCGKSVERRTRFRCSHSKRADESIRGGVKDGTWMKANPLWGITVELEKMKAACESAQQNPAEENSFRQLRLNQWVKQSIRWMPLEKWDSCDFHVDSKKLEGRVCYGGLDLSSTTDITSFVLVFPPEDEDDKYAVLPFFGFQKILSI